jgi:predicted transcriptional regulator
MSTVTIKKIKSNDELHCHFPGQYDRQQCYVELDCTNSILSASYNAEIGGAVPFSVYHGHDQRWDIPCLTADAANSLMEDILPLAERVVAGYESVWDGQNQVAEFDDDARAAIDEINGLCDGVEADECNTISEYDVDEFLDSTVHTHGAYVDIDDIGHITAATSDSELESIESKINQMAESADGNIVFKGSVREWLESVRDNRDDPDWDSESGFSFPKCFTEDEQHRYAVLADYNRAYDQNVTSLHDQAYLLYEKCRQAINDHPDTCNMRIKNHGPYNPTDKKIVLASAACTTGSWCLTRAGEAYPLKFQECEETFEILKLVGFAYPWEWIQKRNRRLIRERDEQISSAAPELPGLQNALNEVTQKLCDLNNEHKRLTERIKTKQKEHDEATARANEWYQSVTKK